MTATDSRLDALAPLDATATPDDEARLAELIVERAFEEERLRRRRPLPRWVRLSMKVMPKVLAIVTIANGLVGLLAIVTPLLTLAFGSTLTDPIHAAYAYICPQRPSHTWFIGGEPMAMEQRMVAMYVVSGLAGLLYVLWTRMKEPLPTGALLLAIAPALIDVALSTADIRPSTSMSRLWTGSLAGFGIIWWAYPRFDAYLRQTQEHVARLKEQLG